MLKTEGRCIKRKNRKLIAVKKRKYMKFRHGLFTRHPMQFTFHYAAIYTKNERQRGTNGYQLIYLKTAINFESTGKLELLN
jgi:hypothetical protein